MGSLWPQLTELPHLVESREYDRLHAVLACEFQRVTTHVRLVDAGVDGLGEDVSPFRERPPARYAVLPRCGDSRVQPASRGDSRSIRGRDMRGMTKGRRSFAPDSATKDAHLQVLYGSDGTRTRDLRRDRPVISKKSPPLPEEEEALQMMTSPSELLEHMRRRR
jgi:hypothetical protein